MSNGHSIAASAGFPSDSSARQATWQGPQSWRRLDPERRLQLIASALRCGDGVFDPFPLAL